METRHRKLRSPHPREHPLNTGGQTYTQDRMLKKNNHVIESIPVKVTTGGDMRSDKLYHSQHTPKASDSVDLYTKLRRGSDYRDTGRPELPKSNDRSGSHLADLRTNYTSRTTRREDLRSHPPEMSGETSMRSNKNLIHWAKVMDRDRVILHGPEQELIPKVEALQIGQSKSMLPHRVITRSPTDKRSELLVDARHLDILKKLKSREIEELQQKFRVRMHEESKDSNVNVTFRGVNRDPDLGAHACHCFTNLLQSTIMNLQRKNICGNLKIDTKRLAQFSSKLQKDGIDVILEHHKGSITLISSPILVNFAEEKLRQFLKTQDVGTTAASGGDMYEKKNNSNPPNTKTSAEEDRCPICLDQIKNKKVLPKCKHEFCDICLQKCLDVKPVCPVCTVPYGVVVGNQPDGTMTQNTSSNSLPGYPGCGTIQIHYNIPGGTQQKNHPNPGKPFSGTQRTAYLPDNTEGRNVLHLLKKAFDQKLTFTVGDSRTTGARDTVTWNDIHHKTNTYGGPVGFGYPDPDYLKRVRDELKAKGVE